MALRAALVLAFRMVFVMMLVNSAIQTKKPTRGNACCVLPDRLAPFPHMRGVTGASLAKSAAVRLAMALVPTVLVFLLLGNAIRTKKPTRGNACCVLPDRLAPSPIL
jgi:hypothetical protein